MNRFSILTRQPHENHYFLSLSKYRMSITTSFNISEPQHSTLRLSRPRISTTVISQIPMYLTYPLPTPPAEIFRLKEKKRKKRRVSKIQQVPWSNTYTGLNRLG